MNWPALAVILVLAAALWTPARSVVGTALCIGALALAVATSAWIANVAIIGVLTGVRITRTLQERLG